MGGIHRMIQTTNIYDFNGSFFPTMNMVCVEDNVPSAASLHKVYIMC